RKISRGNGLRYKRKRFTGLPRKGNRVVSICFQGEVFSSTGKRYSIDFKGVRRASGTCPQRGGRQLVSKPIICNSPPQRGSRTHFSNYTVSIPPFSHWTFGDS